MPCPEKSLWNFVFIHGFGGSYNDNFSASRLSRHFNYYAINLPGHGSEDKPVFDSCIEEYADYVAGYILQKKLTNVLLAGHSLGGGLASVVENKVRANISALFLINPLSASIIEVPNLKNILFPQTLEAMFELCRYAYYNFDAMRQTEGFEASCKEALEIQLKKESYLNGLYDEMCGRKTIKLIEDSEAGISVPTLYMYGRHDRIVPPFEPLARLKGHKHIRFFEFAGSGHCPHNEEPELFTQTILAFVNDSL